ncbi:MAG: (2Fe-2S) ferredoxin domain-containing protein [Erysipelotrichia bacterium]|nr:(2Fe-2S) ferredoxin domain-containing protein [Candidatus Riflebacteria bacterium]NCB39397.1 (2Fe-2S) ferredoxin domain-containing protein [Erysipelotrichia bacterium]
MTRKFKITICSGTACYVLGGAHLMMLEDILPAELKDQVEIVGSACLQACRQADARPPFVKINDYLMESASITKIVDYLRSH